MSDSSSDQAIAESLSFQLGGYATLSCLVLLVYDFLLTLPAELRLIWSRRLTGTSVILILSRYSILLSQIFMVVFNTTLPGQTLTDTSCGYAYLMSQVSLDITDAAVKLLPILRVYALFGQRRSLLILLCPFMIADVVIDTLLLFSSSAITSQGTDDEPFASCLVNAGLEWEILLVISPLLQLIFDSIIFILTLIKTAGHIMQSRKLGTHSIAEVVLHDGSLYFFTIFMIASLDSASGIAAIFPGTMSDTWNNICGMSGQFFDVLIPILIHHLFFNLRAFSDHTVQYSGKAPSNTTASPLSALDFAENRFLGNIGAPLDYNQWDNVDELENTGDGSISEWEILDNTVDPLTTLVPVIYDYEKGEAVRLVPIHKGGWSWSS